MLSETKTLVNYQHDLDVISRSSQIRPRGRTCVFLIFDAIILALFECRCSGGNILCPSCPWYLTKLLRCCFTPCHAALPLDQNRERPGLLCLDNLQWLQQRLAGQQPEFTYNFHIYSLEIRALCRDTEPAATVVEPIATSVFPLPGNFGKVHH